MPPTSYLAFDLGASSGRVILGTLRDGRLRMEELHRFDTPLVEDQGRLEWDLDQLWSELIEGLRRALDQAPALRSLSVDSWGVDYVPLDDNMQPIRNPYSYRDQRTRGLLKEVLQKVPASELYRLTGTQMLEINTLYQLAADRKEEKHLFDETATRLLIADYFLYRFSGRAAVELTLASTTQLMNIRRLDWEEDLMRSLGLDGTPWPEIVPPGTTLGDLLDEHLDDHAGAHPSVVASCSHDTACAVAAAPGVSDAGCWAYLCSGTWSLLGTERPGPILNDEALEASFTNEVGIDGSIRFLKNLTGLWVLQECERLWRQRDPGLTYDQLMDEAREAPSFGRHIDLEASTFRQRGNMPQRVQDYCREHQIPAPEGRGEVVRLILESLAHGYGRTLRELEGLTGEKVEVLHVVGGGAKNDMLCQWTADACGCQVLAGPAEATALGNLLVQARTLGDLPEGTPIRQIVRDSCELTAYQPSG